ncbi:MAG: hypothetical protein KJP00_01560 [Bacteroidia bacterium]|nr:hypothetical protein [Bacteroidia bacterium]
MNTNYLFPHRYRRLGWTMFLPGLVLGILYLFWDIEIPIPEISVFAIVSDEIFHDQKWFQIVETDIYNEILGVLLIIGGILVAFSKEKEEDERIRQIRLESLMWATYVNFAVLLVAMIFVHEMAFLQVMVANMFTILIFFIIRFRWFLNQSNKALS